MIEILLHNIFLSVIFLTPYLLWFQKSHYFQTNRWYLNLSIAFSGILPAIKHFFDAQELIVISYQLPSISINTITTNFLPNPQNNFSLENIYIFVATFLLVRLIYRLVKIAIYIRNEGFKPNEARKYSKKNTSAFSFINYIVLPDNINSSDIDYIINHEKAHLAQKHSYDLIFLQLIKAIFWLNPFYKFYQNSLVLNHEYYADLKAGKNEPQAYLQALLENSRTHKEPIMVHHFHQKSLKKRINMLVQQKSEFRKRNYLLVIPILLAGLFSIACQQEIEKVYVPDDSDYSEIEMPIYEGGAAAMMQYIGNNVIYPEADKKENIEGLSIVQFTVSSKGTIQDVEIPEGARERGTEAMHKEATRVVSSMPKWIPGNKAGTPVAVRFTLPVRYKLREQQQTEE